MDTQKQERRERAELGNTYAKLALGIVIAATIIVGSITLGVPLVPDATNPNVSIWDH